VLLVVLALAAATALGVLLLSTERLRWGAA
jgi:hypothetical protein